MTRTAKLSDLQLTLLMTANQRDDGSLLPIPDHLNNKKGRVEKSIRSLTKRGLVVEHGHFFARQDEQSWLVDIIAYSKPEWTRSSTASGSSIVRHWSDCPKISAYYKPVDFFT